MTNLSVNYRLDLSWSNVIIQSRILALTEYVYRLQAK